MPLLSRSFFVPGFVFASVLITAASADAAVFDHLQCFKVKDSLTKGSYTADIAPSNAAYASVPPGCKIMVPAKLLCVEASKTNVLPAPPGAAAGDDGQVYLCYKAKCAKNQPSATLTDQFGTHTLKATGTQLVCAPVPGTGPTTTTTLPACPDADNDTYTTCAGDCDDSNAAIHPGAAETCDGVDNNCNGVTDEGNPGGGAVCNTGLLGICTAGTTTCSGGALTCNQNASSTAEVCNGLDDNCNGIVDDGNPGGGSSCNTGMLGICSAGTTACSGGALTCNQNTSSTAEICNGLDDNCNGIVDDGNPGGGSSCNTGMLGICSAGTTACSGGALTCNQNTSSTAEVCNGLDDNCNGVIDEGVCGFVDGTVCSSNGQCQNGHCVDGVCCNTACSGICQACVAVKTGSTDGTCSNVSAGTDPDNECAGAMNCSFGACAP